MVKLPYMPDSRFIDVISVRPFRPSPSWALSSSRTTKLQMPSHHRCHGTFTNPGRPKADQDSLRSNRVSSPTTPPAMHLENALECRCSLRDLFAGDVEDPGTHLDSLLRAFPTRCSVVLLAAGLSRRLVSTRISYALLGGACLLPLLVRPSVRVLVLCSSCACACAHRLPSCAHAGLALAVCSCRVVLCLCRACAVVCLCFVCAIAVFLASLLVCVWAGVPLACRRRLHRRSHLRPPPWSERLLSWPSPPLFTIFGR